MFVVEGNLRKHLNDISVHSSNVGTHRADIVSYYLTMKDSPTMLVATRCLVSHQRVCKC